MGASVNFSASSINGEEPISTGPNCSPTIIDSRKTWHSATTAITGVSYSRFTYEMSAPPTPHIIKIQSRKEPSCPAQNVEKR